MCGYHMKKLSDISMEFTPFHSIFPSRMKNNGNFWYIFKYCCISTTFTQFYNLNPQSYTILFPILAYFLFLGLFSPIIFQLKSTDSLLNVYANQFRFLYISLANKPLTAGMKFYKVEQQSFVYKRARYKRNDKFKLNLILSIYNKCRDYCPQKASKVGVVKGVVNFSGR